MESIKVKLAKIQSEEDKINCEIEELKNKIKNLEWEKHRLQISDPDVYSYDMLLKMCLAGESFLGTPMKQALKESGQGYTLDVCKAVRDNFMKIIEMEVDGDKRHELRKNLNILIAFMKNK